MEAGIKMKVRKTKLNNSQKVEQKDQMRWGNRKDSSGWKIQEVELQLMEFPKKEHRRSKIRRERGKKFLQRVWTSRLKVSMFLVQETQILYPEGRKILRAAREKKKSVIRVALDFSVETLEAGRWWNIILNILWKKSFHLEFCILPKFRQM